jgi:ABC-2 type transport system permease protein
MVTGLLLEGKFASVFKNRMVEDTGFPSDYRVIQESVPTKQAFFSDGGLLSNKVNRTKNEPVYSTLGYDRVSKITYGNRDLFLNLVQYFTDDVALFELRGKNWKLRLLDKVKVNSQDDFYRWLNLLLPLLLLAIGGFIFNWRRRWRNEKTAAKH